MDQVEPVEQENEQPQLAEDRTGEPQQENFDDYNAFVLTQR